MDDPRFLSLLTIITEKSYTRTANKLYITQPAVTSHIKSLETEFDIQIFVDKKNFELTKQGRILVEHARRMDNQSRELKEALASSLLETTTLNLGVTESSQCILSSVGLLDVFFKTYHSEANLHVMSSKTIFEYLKSGKLDVAIVDQSFDDDLFTGILLERYMVVPVCYEDGKFAKIKRVTREMLKNNPIIFGSEEEGMTIAAKNALRSCNISLTHTPFFHANSFYLMSKLIESKDGIGFLYDELVPQLNHMKKMEILNYQAKQDIYLVYSQNNFDRDRIKELVRGIRLWLRK